MPALKDVMKIKKLLIANRGEIAIRIARAAFELGMTTVALFSEDDATSLHCRKTDEACALKGSGATAYLDIEQILSIARATGCDAIHPGYGFLSETAQFAARCAEENIIFVGPTAEVLKLFGDKVQARNLAQRTQVPVVLGTQGATSLPEAHAFFASLGDDGAMMIKAISGGGGRGMRAVYAHDQIDAAYERCQSEAQASFNNRAVYVEQLVLNARHIEIQVIGDGSGRVTHLGERECTLQRRNQKIIEIAPSPTLLPAVRERITAAAVGLAEAINYSSLGTFEFLLDAATEGDSAAFVFMEANPRLQVEHTVTEEITGIDLVKSQLQIAGGSTLLELGLTQASIPQAKGFAIQLRVNMETMAADGSALPSGGTLTAFEPPNGPGIRVDTFGYTDYTTNPNFDSLLAKLITHTPFGSFADAVARTYRAVSEFRIQGVPTNIHFLQNLLRHPDVVANRVNTRFIETHIAALLAAPSATHRKFYFDSSEQSRSAASINLNQPRSANAAPANTTPVLASMQGVIVCVNVAEGDVVHAGQQVAVIEAMKMEHIVTVETDGIVRRIDVKSGDTLFQNHPLLYVEAAEFKVTRQVVEEVIDLDHIRADLEEVQKRHAAGLDAARPDAVARRRKVGQRSARENVADLCDADSFIEYGALTYAAQRARYTIEELQKISPADGLITGIGSVNSPQFDDSKARCLVMAYDYTVFAGTQGTMNHKKIDRMLQLSEQWRLPIVLFAEGGGGRPGDIENHTVAMLNTTTFLRYAKLSGLVPRVCIVSGRSFAGNAALVGCSDVIIATANATVGMGGPAMVEGGGLGAVAPEKIGPASMQGPNGVFDIVVPDEASAVAVAKRYLSYFQGSSADWSCIDQRTLRQMIPENRLRVYEIGKVIEAIADVDSVLELRREFGIGIVTAFIRIEGRPIGILANNPAHLGGAIDADAADKAARFIQLCDAFDIPLLSLCDTPGFMVGPDAEKSAMVRHVSRIFVAAASITVPFFMIVLRKGYGLGSIAMAGGSFHATFFTVSWPCGEFGAMGIEGAAKLGYRKELEAVSDPDQRQALLEKLVSAAYEKGKAISMASYLEIDDVIDPAESRKWIVRGLRSLPAALPREGKKRNFVDTW